MADDEQLHSNIEYTSDCGVDTSFCSDDFGFEKVSIACSESAYVDEAVVNATSNEHLLKTADMSETARVAPTLSYEVKKPPVMSDEVRWQSPPSPAVDRVLRSSLCTELIGLAKNLDKSMAADVDAEVEKRLTMERAEYERQISYLQAQLVAKAKAEPQSSALREENERLMRKCAELERQNDVLQQQANRANRQNKEYEDELYALRARFSAERVQPPQQLGPTFEIVKASPALHVNPIPQTTSTPHTAASQKKWECPRCTYHNTSSMKQCEMCEFPQRLDHRTQER